MNRKHIGASVFEDIKKWEKEDPTFRKAVDEYKEKAMLGKMLQEVRKKEHITQAQLADKAHVPQSVIARIETGAAKTLPRIDLFNRILGAVGYETLLTAKKGRIAIQVAL